MSLFKSKKVEPVSVEEPEEDLDDELDELDDLDEDKEEPEPIKKQVEKIKKDLEEPVEEEIPEPPQAVTPFGALESNLKITANRHYEIVNQLKSKNKITEKSDLKFGGVKSKEELYREFIREDYLIKEIVKEMVEDHKITEKDVENIIKSAKDMTVEELI